MSGWNSKGGELCIGHLGTSDRRLKATRRYERQADEVASVCQSCGTMARCMFVFRGAYRLLSPEASVGSLGKLALLHCRYLMI